MPWDLQYLMILQNLRAATGGAFDQFFDALSKIAIEVLPLFPYLVFWGVSRKWGYRFLLGSYAQYVLSSVVKLTVCAYRPWVRSDQIVPALDSEAEAGGYSFPSGHASSAAVIYGTSALSQKGKRKGLTVLCMILILLTGFSRNYLGVHTPQDVFFGIRIGGGASSVSSSGTVCSCGVSSFCSLVKSRGFSDTGIWKSPPSGLSSAG